MSAALSKLIDTWCWRFHDDSPEPGFDVRGEACSSLVMAKSELNAAQQELYPEWADVQRRPSHILWVARQIAEQHQYLHLECSLAIASLINGAPDKASKLVRPSSPCQNCVPGFWNPGWNCCYLNATLQCLLSCSCVRENIHNAATVGSGDSQTSSSGG